VKTKSGGTEPSNVCSIPEAYEKLDQVQFIIRDQINQFIRDTGLCVRNISLEFDQAIGQPPQVVMACVEVTLAEGCICTQRRKAS